MAKRPKVKVNGLDISGVDLILAVMVAAYLSDPKGYRRRIWGR